MKDKKRFEEIVAVLKSAQYPEDVFGENPEIAAERIPLLTQELEDVSSKLPTEEYNTSEEAWAARQKQILALFTEWGGRKLSLKEYGKIHRPYRFKFQMEVVENENKLYFRIGLSAGFIYITRMPALVFEGFLHHDQVTVTPKIGGDRKGYVAMYGTHCAGEAFHSVISGDPVNTLFPKNFKVGDKIEILSWKSDTIHQFLRPFLIPQFFG